ncbi:MAG: hypothetical protein DRI57_25930 [Deltaproteobacteria bacterium]|nr:MAG: hypothetical protein DRI57_25930 [Deltaproteobacteria bacterium]
MGIWENGRSFSIDKKPGFLSHNEKETRLISSCRTGFATLLAGRGLQPRPQCFVSPLLPDRVCNPVRNVLSVPGSISFGRVCKPRPAISLMHMGVHGHIQGLP